MKPLIRITALVIMVLAAGMPKETDAMKSLSPSQMQGVTAQTGVTMAQSDLLFYSGHETLQVDDADSAGYMRLESIESLVELKTGLIIFDIFTVSDVASPAYNTSMFHLEGRDWDMNSILRVGNINVCGTDIGSLAVSGASINSFHLYAGPHGAGVDVEFGFQGSIDSISFQYNDTPVAPETGSLVFTGITFADSFSGTDNDPSTWVAENEFTAGDILNDSPVTFDVNGDHILVTGSARGSVRVENVNFNGTDMGMVRIDNMNVHRLDIEIPGRGLGKP